MKQFSLKWTLLLSVLLFHILSCTKNDSPRIHSLVQNNLLPKADAGPDQIIDLPSTTVKLTGKGEDKDGTIISYQWYKLSGPAYFAIVSPQSASTEVQNLMPGTYAFILQVTDNSGGTDIDRVMVEIRDPNYSCAGCWDY